MPENQLFTDLRIHAQQFSQKFHRAKTFFDQDGKALLLCNLSAQCQSACDFETNSLAPVGMLQQLFPTVCQVLLGQAKLHDKPGSSRFRRLVSQS